MRPRWAPWSRRLGVGKHKAHRINVTTDLEIQWGRRGRIYSLHALPQHLLKSSVRP